MDKEYLIKKWLANELTEAEWEAFKQLDDHRLNMDILENAKHFKAPQFSTIDEFEKLNEQITAPETPVRRLNWMNPWLRIASVVVIGLGIYFQFFFNNVIRVQTSAGEKTTMELPDASMVVLNAVSEVHYSKNRWNQNREVTLDGEAYFDVAKGATFDVITTTGKVSVLGTRFNVKKRDEYFEVKCFEGVVSVSFESKLTRLLAGDTYRIFKGVPTLGKTSFQQAQWTKNRSSFKSVPFHEVIAELERQYGVEITATDINSDRVFTGGFIHKDLESALMSIAEPLGISYSIETSTKVRLY